MRINVWNDAKYINNSIWWYYVSKFIQWKNIFFKIYVSNVPSCYNSLWIIVYFMKSLYQVYLYNLMTQALPWHHNGWQVLQNNQIMWRNVYNGPTL